MGKFNIAIMAGRKPSKAPMDMEDESELDDASFDEAAADFFQAVKDEDSKALKDSLSTLIDLLS